MRRTCALISVLVLANVLSPYTFSSETAFTLSPVKLYREAPRGGVAEIGLVVINDNPLRGQAFKVYVTDLTMDKKGQAVFRPPGTSEWSAGEARAWAFGPQYDYGKNKCPAQSEDRWGQIGCNNGGSY